MAYTSDKEPSGLTALTSLANDDTILVGDTSDANEVVKTITKANLLTDLADETQTLTNKTIDANNNTISNLAIGAEVTGASTDLTDTAALTYNADTDVSANGWVVDEDNMASNLATKVPTQQSVKAYVDANVGTVSSIDDIGDVTITTVANDEVLQYTGAGWENQTLTEAGIQAIVAEGAFVDGDKTKLDGIETGADVTDTTNVTAAGALMDSEVTNLADVKAFDPADYSPAQEVVSGSLTAVLNTYYVNVASATYSDPSPTEGRGFIVFVRNGTATVGGTGYSTAGTIVHRIYHSGAWANYTYFVSTASFTTADETKLDGIETGADVTDTANVTAAGALMDSEVDADIKTLSLPANTTISTFGASLVDDADAAAARTTLGAGTLSNVSEDTTPTLGGTLDANSNDITNIELAEFEQEVDNGNSGTADTVDWGAGNMQKSTLTGNCTFTFTAPSGPARLQLKLIQDGTGSRTATWPATVKWPSGTAPTLTTDASAIDIVTFWYDGTNYYGVASLDFS